MKTKHRWMDSYFVYSVSNELIAKLLVSLRLGPSVAVSRGSEFFFGDVYETLFDDSITLHQVLAPWILYDEIRDTYLGNAKPFHEFDRQFVFKNRALFYLLRMIYDFMRGSGITDWEKKLVLFWEDSTIEEWNKFFQRFSRIVSSMFETIYKGYSKSGETYHNTYLQRSDTLREIKRDQKKRVEEHKQKVREDFKRILDQ